MKTGPGQARPRGKGGPWGSLEKKIMSNRTAEGRGERGEGREAKDKEEKRRWKEGQQRKSGWRGEEDKKGGGRIENKVGFLRPRVALLALGSWRSPFLPPFVQKLVRFGS